VRYNRITSPPEPLHFEPSQIEQVVVNLLDNACRFAPKYGVVEVAAYPCFWDRRQRGRSVPPRARERRSKRQPAPNAYRST
jgi:signal transduction histidine kinase